MFADTHAHYFLLICLAVALVVVYFLVQPFLGPLILAAVFAFLFQPVFQRLVRFFRGRESAAAFATTLFTVLVLVLPLTILGNQIFKESSDLYYLFSNGDGTEVSGAVERVVNNIAGFLPLPEGANVNVGQYVEQGLEALVSNLGAIFSGIANLLLDTFVFLVAFYFLLKDGRRLKDYFVAVSPLADRDDLKIATRLEAAVSSSVKGALTIGLIQGVLTGVGFALFGVPNPVLWGSVAAIMALVPGIGTALITVPGALFLFFTGSVFGGIGLLVWGATAVGLVDNLLGPRLIGRGMHLHPLAIFIAVLGGLALFGPIGFILGPLALSLCLALIDIYFSLKEEDSKAGAR